jgi:hypothetical protein
MPPVSAPPPAAFPGARIPGEGGMLDELLLVPYFGACIHIFE